MANHTDDPKAATASAELFTLARECMVNSQIRPNKVNDPRILGAMRRLPREAFLPPSLAHCAYLDEDIPLGKGRFMMEPMVLARLIQSALLQDNERVLVVGAGSGYGAAVLSACGARVTALEEDPALLALADSVLSQQAPDVSLVSGPLASGWAAGAPYDIILIEGAVAEVPQALGNQMHAETGRLLAVLARQGRTTQAIMGEPTSTGLGVCPLFDCGTPLIPSLRKTPAFEF